MLNGCFHRASSLKQFGITALNGKRAISGYQRKCQLLSISEQCRYYIERLNPRRELWPRVAVWNFLTITQHEKDRMRHHQSVTVLLLLMSTQGSAQQAASPEQETIQELVQLTSRSRALLSLLPPRWLIPDLQPRKRPATRSFHSFLRNFTNSAAFSGEDSEK